MAAAALLAHGDRGIAAEARSGTVIAWSNEPFLPPPSVPDAARRDIIAIAAGTAHLVALRADGVVIEWGIHDPVAEAVGGVSNVVAIAAGRAHTAALRSDGTVVAWGRNFARQIEVPRGLSNVTAVTAASDHTFALRSDGTVVGWGEGTNNLPIPAGVEGVVSLSTGETGTVAIRAGQAPIYWHILLATPFPLRFLSEYSDVAPGSLGLLARRPDGAIQFFDFGGRRVVSPTRFPLAQAIAARGERFLAAGADGSLYEWQNSDAHRDEYRPLPVPAGVRSAAAVACGSTFSMALLTPESIQIQAQPVSLTVSEFEPARFAVGTADPTLTFQWRHHGEPIEGATGPTLEIPVAWIGVHDGRYDVVLNNGVESVPSESATLTIHPASPGAAVAWTDEASPETLIPAAARHGLRSIALGGFGGLALRHDGTVVSWPTPAPETLGGVVAISAGQDHYVALLKDGQVVAWGDHHFEQTHVPRTLTNVIAIAAGGSHTLALRRNGSVVAWGDNQHGQCAVPAELSDVIAITAGLRHSVALGSDGKLAQWGNGGYPASQTPPDLQSVTAIAAGGFHTLALQTNGTVAAWGSDGDGQVSVPRGLSGVVAIAAGFNTSLALTHEGTVVAWGPNWVRQIPAGLREVIVISAGADYVAALISPPRLNMIWKPGETHLAWPSNLDGYLLQSSDRLTDDPWSTLPAGEPDPDGFHHWVAPASAASGQQYFRLFRP